VNRQFPGHVFKGQPGKRVTLQIAALLSTQEPIEAIEIIKNGKVERSLPFRADDEYYQDDKVSFDESGWFLVRAITKNPRTFRFASTGPYYVEIGDTKSRISKASAQFFLDWVRERKQRVKLSDETEKREVLSYHDTAERFWQELVQRANAE
jgi:hypothetical protein